MIRSRRISAYNAVTFRKQYFVVLRSPHARPFAFNHLAPVPERPISANPGLKILFYFNLYLPSYALSRVQFYAIITESRSKDTKVFCKLE